ncbi:hypothetical protein B296_00013094 [Ensete ventricosum]|uniref:Uncharacterized protein n=1 Tax=Ensete ventricosum TaxID=4639 RepID=A0A427B8R9_ENSVE|nr:hypothetical protein B296_00013094 [Ensete ventricosum]
MGGKSTSYAELLTYLPIPIMALVAFIGRKKEDSAVVESPDKRVSRTATGLGCSGFSLVLVLSGATEFSLVKELGGRVDCVNASNFPSDEPW